VSATFDGHKVEANMYGKGVMESLIESNKMKELTMLLNLPLGPHNQPDQEKVIFYGISHPHRLQQTMLSLLIHRSVEGRYLSEYTLTKDLFLQRERMNVVRLMIEKSWSINSPSDDIICPLAVPLLLTDNSICIGTTQRAIPFVEELLDFFVKKKARIRTNLKSYMACYVRVKLLPLYVTKSLIHIETMAYNVDSFSSHPHGDSWGILQSYLACVILAACTSGISLSTVQKIHTLIEKRGVRDISSPISIGAVELAFEYARQVPSLKKIARKKVRLVLHDCDKFDSAHISQLDLPKELIDYVQLNEIMYGIVGSPYAEITRMYHVFREAMWADNLLPIYQP
jgi:hypothetical protein